MTKKKKDEEIVPDKIPELDFDAKIAEIKARIHENQSIHTDNIPLPIPNKDKHWWQFKKKKNLAQSEKHEQGMGIVTKVKDRLSPEKSFLITMMLRTGGKRRFVLNTSKEEFEFEDGTYIIDSSLKDYVYDDAKYELIYHQDFPLPLRFLFDANETKSALETYSAQSGLEVEAAMNPMLIKRFIDSKIAEGVMKGQLADEFFHTMKTVMFIILAVVILHFLVFVVGSGMLKNIKIPGMH